MKDCCGPGYTSPQDAIKAPREKLLYTIAIYTGTGIQKPDYLEKRPGRSSAGSRSAARLVAATTRMFAAAARRFAI